MVQKVPPLHLQIYHRLREDIQNSLYPLGSRLPTEEELSVRFKASRPTIRQALTSLSNEGLIMRRPRTGSTVVASQPQIVLSHSVNSVNELLDYPGQMTREILDSGYIKADQDLAKELHCPLHMEWFRLITLRFQNHATVPLCLTTYYILPKYAGVIKHKKHLTIPISEQIVEMFDEAILKAKVEVYSEIIPEKYYSALQITSQDSSLVVMRSYLGKDQQTFQITTSHHPQERYRYSFELIREHRSANPSLRKP